MENLIQPNSAVLNIDDAGTPPSKDNAQISKDYYAVATNFYLQGWGRQFHFGVRKKGQTLEESLLYNELYLAEKLGLKRGEKCLDVGCGVGGPMINIATETGASITGINNVAYQVQKGTNFLKEAGLEKTCSFLECNWMDIPLQDESFDKAYEIEATCHAADRRVEVFSEINRLLKHGGLFGGYEWVMTENYNPQDPEQLDIKKKIEEGNGISNLTSYTAVQKALEDAGFEVLEFHDMAKDNDKETPWYLPFKGEGLRSLATNPTGRFIVRNALQFLETIHVVPKGTSEVQKMLEAGADGLLLGGEKDIFTPMFFFLAKKVRAAKN